MVAERTRLKILGYFMDMAAERPWAQVDLLALSERCDIKYSTLRGSYSGKLALLEDFSVMVDQKVLDGIQRGIDVEETAKDRLFDILMMRMDMLLPYRIALRNITSAARADPALAIRMNRVALRSMGWMLAGAKIEARGVKGAAKLQGLAFAYGRALRTWMTDEDEGLARTMASLDRELQRGERALRRLEQVERAVLDLGCFFCRLKGDRRDAGETDKVDGASQA